MKLFNNHSGLRGLPCFAEGIYWATGLSLTTPFTEGRPGVNNKASPPGRHQEQAPKQRCTFRPTTFSSVQFSLKTAQSKIHENTNVRYGVHFFYNRIYLQECTSEPHCIS